MNYSNIIFKSSNIYISFFLLFFYCLNNKFNIKLCGHFKIFKKKLNQQIDILFIYNITIYNLNNKFIT